MQRSLYSERAHIVIDEQWKYEVNEAESIIVDVAMYFTGWSRLIHYAYNTYAVNKHIAEIL